MNMKNVEKVLGEFVVKVGEIMAEGDLNVNSPWFYHQPMEPDSLREKREEKANK